MRHATAGIAALLIAAGHAAAADGFAWTGQGIVNRPDTAYDGPPTVAYGPTGRPCAVWETNDSDSKTSWAFMAGPGWTVEDAVLPVSPGVVGNLRHRMAFDGVGAGWLVWHVATADNRRDVDFSRLLSSGWTRAQQVNVPDSTDLDFAPKVACGGGKVWCVWYGGPTDMSPYVVYASRWNDSAGCWGPETQVSPQNNAQNWFCDVAVDSLGTPHVVWLATLLYAVYYSRFDGTGWTTPQLVNDTSQVKAASWGAPQVVCDRTGRLHVSFTGVASGADTRDIFYASNDGTGWTDCEMVTYDSSYSEWYSAIAADRPDNVWISYDRQGEGADQFRVYAQHYDGVEWSRQARLDDDSAYYDGCPAICLDAAGLPLVAWRGEPYARTNFEIYSNRYARVPQVPDVRVRAPAGDWLSVPTVCADGWIAPTLRLTESGHVSMELFDDAGRRLASQHIELRPTQSVTMPLKPRVPSGVYFLHVRTDSVSVVRKVLVVKRDS